MFSISETPEYTYYGTKLSAHSVACFDSNFNFLRQTYTIRLQMWQVYVGNMYHNITTIAIYTVQGILSRASKAACPKENSGSRLFF